MIAQRQRQSSPDGDCYEPTAAEPLHRPGSIRRPATAGWRKARPELLPGLTALAAALLVAVGAVGGIAVLVSLMIVLGH